MAPLRSVLAIGIACGLAACGGSGSAPAPAAGGATAAPPDPGCDGSCTGATSFLSATDVETVISQAVAEAQARTEAATIAVVDRVGNVLGVFRMTGADTEIKITSTPPGNAISGGLEGIFIVPDTMAAIAKAITGAYLSSEGNAFTTRTASQIVQEHFNPGEAFQPAGPLFGVQFSQLPCSDLSARFDGMPGAGPHRSPLGLAADPGGLPLYRSGTPVGGVGVIADGIYSADKDPTGDVDADADEFIALAATVGFEAPENRLASAITVDGKTLRFSDARYDDLQSAAAPAFASIDTIAGELVAVAGYYDGVTTLSGTAFGQPASGIRPDSLDYPGTDAYVLVDDSDTGRYRPRAGTDGAAALTADEVRSLLQSALHVARRSRAQIRRPRGTAARVSISVVDTNGEILAIARSRDAPVFGIDVSLQKARTAALFSSAGAAMTLAALPPAAYLDGTVFNDDDTLFRPPLRVVQFSGYVDAAQDFLASATALTDGAIAFSDRAGGNLSRPFYPDGIDNTDNGPFSKPAGRWSPFSVGLQLDIVYNALINHVGFVAGLPVADVGQNCSGVIGIDDPGNLFSVSAASGLLANGIQIFPGSVPVYRGETLVGGIGVSGDGVDQDDLVAFLGLHEAGMALGTINNAPVARRADTLTPKGTRLRYINCPQTPYIDSDEQNVCADK